MHVLHRPEYLNEVDVQTTNPLKNNFHTESGQWTLEMQHKFFMDPNILNTRNNAYAQQHSLVQIVKNVTVFL